MRSVLREYPLTRREPWSVTPGTTPGITPGITWPQPARGVLGCAAPRVSPHPRLSPGVRITVIPEVCLTPPRVRATVYSTQQLGDAERAPSTLDAARNQYKYCYLK